MTLLFFVISIPERSTNVNGIILGSFFGIFGAFVLVAIAAFAMKKMKTKKDVEPAAEA